MSEVQQTECAISRKGKVLWQTMLVLDLYTVLLIKITKHTFLYIKSVLAGHNPSGLRVPIHRGIKLCQSFSKKPKTLLILLLS